MSKNNEDFNNYIKNYSKLKSFCNDLEKSLDIDNFKIEVEIHPKTESTFIFSLVLHKDSLYSTVFFYNLKDFLKEDGKEMLKKKIIYIYEKFSEMEEHLK